MKVYEVPEGTPRLLTNPTEDVTDNAVNADLSIVTHYYPSVGMKYFHDIGFWTKNSTDLV